MSAVVAHLPMPAAANDAECIPGRVEYIGRLRDILSSLEADDAAQFELRLNQLMRLREDGLFVNLAKLTRELHQAVKDLNFDDRLQQLAGSEIPDACVRLDYVLKLGEDAAHHTLDLCDSSRLLLDRLNASGGNTEALNDISRGLRSNFSAIAQAQEYQDLSGQVIRRVISLVHNIEGALIKLLRATSEGVRPATAPSAGNGELAGPTIPGLASGGQSQQDADALLAELGF